mmetsp:Transcript_29226/g.52945  ORF Transcript_29226/g.52945 Transcript_29226/m.52945 type:complete len:213 (-) Transcript_29226:854-1492(-)
MGSFLRRHAGIICSASQSSVHSPPNPPSRHPPLPEDVGTRNYSTTSCHSLQWLNSCSCHPRHAPNSPRHRPEMPPHQFCANFIPFTCRCFCIAIAAAPFFAPVHPGFGRIQPLGGGAALGTMIPSNGGNPTLALILLLVVAGVGIDHASQCGVLVFLEGSSHHVVYGGLLCGVSRGGGGGGGWLFGRFSFSGGGGGCGGGGFFLLLFGGGGG